MNLIDEFFLEAHPNPKRIGCPPENIIQSIAQNRLPADHPARTHLAKCSECYAEYQSFKIEKGTVPLTDDVTQSWNSSAPASTQEHLRTIQRSATKWEPTGQPPAPSPAMPPRDVPSAEYLDYGVYVPRDPVSDTLPNKFSKHLELFEPLNGEPSLPIGLVDLKVVLGPTEKPGPYRLSFVQGTNQLDAEFSTTGVLVKEHDHTILHALVDLRRFAEGAATLTLIAIHPESTRTYAIQLRKEQT